MENNLQSSFQNYSQAPEAASATSETPVPKEVSATPEASAPKAVSTTPETPEPKATQTTSANQAAGQNPIPETTKPASAVPPKTSSYGTWPIYQNKPFSPNGTPNAAVQNPGMSTSAQSQISAWQNTIPAPQPKPLNEYEQRLKSGFGRYGTCSLAIGILSAFCFYQNPNAVTYPLFIAAIYLAAFRLLPPLGFPIKKDSFFLAAAAIALGINTATTASPILHTLNNIAQLLLGSVFLLHQCYADKEWNIEKYLTSIVLLWFQALTSLPVPFSHTIALCKRTNQGRNRNVLIFLSGCLAGIPAVIYMAYLLSDADAVFQMLIEEFVWNFLNPSTLFVITLIIIFSTLTVCCLMGSICSMNIPQPKDPKRHNPLFAISFTTMIALLYLLFCGIQIIYLFAGKGRLPAEMTYSEYAHQGFFQLLAVAVLNLIFVLNCFKYFRKHPMLTFLLTLISLCTCVMIASAAYRMLLYVGAYSLTFLRLFVLWFLGVLAILMLGVLAMIFMPHFPLFRFSLIVITLAYCGFAWSIPDLQIARYNIAQEGGKITLDSARYFTRHLSADAAPAIAQAPLSPEVTYSELYYSTQPECQHTVDKVILISSLNNIPWRFYDPDSLLSLEEQIARNKDSVRNWNPGIRKYNFSMAKAKKLAEQADNRAQ